VTCIWECPVWTSAVAPFTPTEGCVVILSHSWKNARILQRLSYHQILPSPFQFTFPIIVSCYHIQQGWAQHGSCTSLVRLALLSSHAVSSVATVRYTERIETCFFFIYFSDRAYSYNSGKWPTWRTVSSILCLFESSTCFEQGCAHLQEDNCINTTSGIITPC